MKSNSKKYISTTACVKCNKGSQPTYLKVEDHTQVGNNYVVTETATSQNCFEGTFGTCSRTNKPCTMGLMPTWINTAQKFRSGDYPAEVSGNATVSDLLAQLPATEGIIKEDSTCVCKSNAGYLYLSTTGQEKVEIEWMSFADLSNYIPVKKNKSASIIYFWSPSLTKNTTIGWYKDWAFSAKARFTLPDTMDSAQIKVAVYKNSQLLASSNETTYTKANSGSYTYKTFYIGNLNIYEGFDKHDISLTWYYKNEAGNWSQIKSIAVKLYTFPHYPGSPWSRKTQKNHQFPWTDVLDLLLDHKSTDPDGENITFSLRGLDDRIEIASTVTELVFRGFGKAYDTISGATQFARWDLGGLDLSSFLYSLNSSTMSLVSEKIALPYNVNCSDCAALTSTFANILGCNLYQIVFGNSGFYCNRINSIGDKKDEWKHPFQDYYSPVNGEAIGAFSYHEIAFESSLYWSNKIYDACLKVDKKVLKHRASSSGYKSGGDVAYSTRVPALPADIQFAAKSVRSVLDSQDTTFPQEAVRVNDDSDQKYLEWLVVNDAACLNDALNIRYSGSGYEGTYKETSSSRRPVF